MVFMWESGQKVGHNGKANCKTCPGSSTINFTKGTLQHTPRTAKHAQKSRSKLPNIVEGITAIRNEKKEEMDRRLGIWRSDSLHYSPDTASPHRVQRVSGIICSGTFCDLTKSLIYEIIFRNMVGMLMRPFPEL